MCIRDRLIRTEEERFESVLITGLPRLEEFLDSAASGHRVLAGDDAFRLYDTFGVPLDFIQDMATDRQVTLDHAAFERAMEAQREKARAGHGFGAAKAESLLFEEATASLRGTADRFEGYAATRMAGAPILACLLYTSPSPRDS